jgi:hypothetical protein
MESKKPLSPFQEVHKKAQEALDHAREVRKKDAELRKNKAEEEAIREGSTVPKRKLRIVRRVKYIPVAAVRCAQMRARGREPSRCANR